MLLLLLLLLLSSLLLLLMLLYLSLAFSLLLSLRDLLFKYSFSCISVDLCACLSVHLSISQNYVGKLATKMIPNMSICISLYSSICLFVSHLYYQRSMRLTVSLSIHFGTKLYYYPTYQVSVLLLFLPIFILL